MWVSALVPSFSDARGSLSDELGTDLLPWPAPVFFLFKFVSTHCGLSFTKVFSYKYVISMCFKCMTLKKKSASEGPFQSPSLAPWRTSFPLCASSVPPRLIGVALIKVYMVLTGD